MSKFRTAAFGAVVFVGMALSAGAQAPVKTDSARLKDGTVRRERVEGQRRGRMERGMRQGKMRHRMHDRGARGMRGGQFGSGTRGRFGADLNLTDAQKTRIKAIDEKYQPQFKALRDQGQTQFKALRDGRQKGDTSAAARQRFQQQREQFRQRSQAIRVQQQNEIRGILTPEQRTKVDAARNEQARRMEERAREMQERARQLRSR